MTGRRASQGGARGELKPLEIDPTGLYKLNPFFSWKFSDVKEYVDANDVPRNALLSQGYKSVGDWHSTAKSGDGEDGERAGRWKGKQKTECGLHENYFELRRKATLAEVSGRFPKSKLTLNECFRMMRRRRKCCSLRA